MLGQVGVKDGPGARGSRLFGGGQPLAQQFGDRSPARALPRVRWLSQAAAVRGPFLGAPPGIVGSCRKR
jgi:hypothetical protein